jgi:hypothetical protein
VGLAPRALVAAVPASVLDLVLVPAIVRRGIAHKGIVPKATVRKVIAHKGIVPKATVRKVIALRATGLGQTVRATLLVAGPIMAAVTSGPTASATIVIAAPQAEVAVDAVAGTSPHPSRKLRRLRRPPPRTFRRPSAPNLKPNRRVF